MILKTIGTGASCKVVQCLLPSSTDDSKDKYYGMKIIKRSFLNKNEALLVSELQALKQLNHPNIIRLYEIIDDPNEPNVYLVMDLLEGGTIQQKINKSKDGLENEELRRLVRQIVSALAYCHNDAKICHRDLKPENILLDKEGLAYLIDFGLSSKFFGDRDSFKKTQGSIFYFAPEMVRVGCKKRMQARRTDIWALGVTIYHMATKKLPFNSLSVLGIQS